VTFCSSAGRTTSINEGALQLVLQMNAIHFSVTARGLATY